MLITVERLGLQVSIGKSLYVFRYLTLGIIEMVELGIKYFYSTALSFSLHYSTVKISWIVNRCSD
jgi:hypothetical protein